MANDNKGLTPMMRQFFEMKSTMYQMTISKKLETIIIKFLVK